MTRKVRESGEITSFYLQPADGGPVAAFGSSADGHADVGTGQDQGDRGDGEDRHDNRHQLVGVEDRRAQLELERTWHAERLVGGGEIGSAPQTGDQQGPHGEELGQTETVLTFDELTDPAGINFWPEEKGRDGCRTPMVWEASAPNTPPIMP